MSTRSPLRVLLAFIAAPLASALFADPAPPPPAASPGGPEKLPSSAEVRAAAPGAADEQVVQLSPFEVASSRDNSYGALQSNALTAFSMDLQKMPATAEVFTQTFIKDTQSLTIEQMLVDYSGIVGYSPGDAGAYTESAGDRDGGGGLSIRGFGNSGGIKLDGFFGPPSSTRSAAGTTPTFMIENVQVIEGPQSLLYGAIGAGGVVNAIYKRAEFGVSRGSADYRVNDLGGKTGEFDANVGSGWFALRVAATNQDNATVRRNLGNTTLGYYVQAAVKLPHATIVRLIHNKYETDATNAVTPTLRGTAQLPTTNPLANDTPQYLAATGQVPAGIFNTDVNWNNISSFAGWWGDEPSTIVNNSLEIETTLTPWLSAKLVGLYNHYSDWRDTTSASTIDAPGARGNPYGVDALQVNTPNLNYQSQLQRAVQLNLLATNDLFNGKAHSQTVLGGYLNHIGPSFGSSGIQYEYFQADSNWNPVSGGSAQTYGRIPIPNQYIPLDGRLMKYPLFRPGDSRITLNGVNYILQPYVEQSAAYKGYPITGVPTNPYGLVPNNGKGGVSGSFNPGTDEHEIFMDIGNYTDWFGGKFTTLAGLSLDKAITYNFGQSSYTFLPWTRYNGYEIGAIWQTTPWMGVYADFGTSATPAGSTSDLYGNPLGTPKAKGQPELGLKLHTPDERYTAQVSWDLQTRDNNEIQVVDTSYLNAVNPSGLNGRYGNGPNRWVNIDRTATSVEFTGTAQPTPDWRIRLNASYLFARVLNDVSYRQLYNDQFKVNSSGQATFGNGTVIYVNGSAANAASAGIVAPGSAGATPLTLAMINNPSSPYYAMPDPSSGSITSATLATILGSSGGPAGSVGAQEVAANGESATGVTGLPLSAIQYDFASPFPGDKVPVFAAGNPTTGYPGWQWNLETDYTISHGLLKGLGFYASASVQYSIRAYYTYYPSASASLGSEASSVVNENRVLVGYPPVSDCGFGVHYEHRFGRFTFKTGVNVANVFNHDRFYVLPQSANGTYLQATQRNPPRLYSWTSEIDF